MGLGGTNPYKMPFLCVNIFHYALLVLEGPIVLPIDQAVLSTRVEPRRPRRGGNCVLFGPWAGARAHIHYG